MAIEDAIMSIVADKQLSEWLVTGSIAGISLKEEEKEAICRALKN